LTCNWEDQEEHQEYNHLWVLGLGFGVWIFGFGVQGVHDDERTKETNELKTDDLPMTNAVNFQLANSKNYQKLSH